MATLSSIITPTNITTASNTQTLTNKTITGGILNGSLGLTTPSTGAFTTLSTSGDSSIVASQAFATTAGRGYLQINGSSSTGVLQIGTKQADADGNLCSLIEAHDINSTSGTTRVGYMAYRLVGATANNRGSTLSIFTKPNGSTGLEMATFSSTGLAVTGDISSTARITTNDSAVRSGLTGGTMTAVNTNTAGSASPSLYIENNSDTGYGALQVYAKGSRSGTASAIVTKLDGTTTDYHIDFINDNGIVGTISTNASATAYNTSSDYRLKEITGPVVDSGTFIDALKPKAGTWKVDGSKFVGFLAHEFAEVSPLSVSGEKDAVDADGKPVYQSMQASSSEVIANLVAELQSLRKRLAALESK